MSASRLFLSFPTFVLNLIRFSTLQCFISLFNKLTFHNKLIMRSRNGHRISNKSSKIYRSATQLFSLGRFGPALCRFLVLSKAEPNIIGEIYDDILQCIDSIVPELEHYGRHRDILKLYESSLEVYENSAQLNFSLGCYLSRNGYDMEAATYLSLSAHSCSAQLRPLSAAERTECGDLLDRTCCKLVDRWHFSMLNDRHRNSCYRGAIKQLLDQLPRQQLVLDVGAGTGMLSMIAVDCGAERVAACEESRAMYNIAQVVLADNEKTDKVELINKNSSDLVVGRDIPCRASLLVTEVFDCGLFGEHVLTTLDYAWCHLLSVSETTQPSRVLPSRAALFLCAVECEFLRREFGSCSCSGCDSSCFYRRLQEPYWSEQLNELPGGYKLLTRPCHVISVDFNSHRDICRLLDGPVSHHVLPCCDEGRVDALVAWFTLWLTDSITISTSPLTEPDHSISCWEQAVFPLTGRAVEVTTSDSLTVSVTCAGGQLNANLVHPEDAQCNAALPLGAETMFFVKDNLFADWLSKQLSEWLDNESSPQQVNVLNILPHAAILSRALSPSVLSRCCVVDRACMIGDTPTGEQDLYDQVEDGVRESGWHVVVWYPFLSSGHWNRELARLVLSSEAAGSAVLFPARVCVRAVLVVSRDLVNMFSVHSSNTLDYNCSAINLFQAHTLQDILLGSRRHLQVSEITTLADIALKDLNSNFEREFSISLTNNVKPDALIFWFQPSPLDGVDVARTNQTCCAVMCDSNFDSSRLEVTGNIYAVDYNICVNFL